MGDSEAYQEYLERLEEAVGARRRLEAAEFDELLHEFERLELRIDPDDIQLDEWKRVEELRFLLLLGSEDEDD